MQSMLEIPKTYEDAFAEKVNKITFRDFHNNTRMDIKNVELK